MATIRRFLQTPAGKTAEHLAAVFSATFATTLYFNGQHLFAEHGLSALKSAAPALAVTALVAGYKTVRPLVAAVAAKRLVSAVKPPALPPDTPPKS